MGVLDQVLLALAGILPAAWTVACVVAELALPTEPGERPSWPSSWLREDS